MIACLRFGALLLLSTSGAVAAFAADKDDLMLGAAHAGANWALVQDDDAATEDELLDEGKHKITFRPFHLSVMRKGRVRGTVDIQLVLQLNENRDYESLNALKPQLRADITAALSTLAQRRWRVSKPIDPDIVSAYLTPFIEQRVGPGRLNVYVLQALINPV